MQQDMITAITMLKASIALAAASQALGPTARVNYLASQFAKIPEAPQRTSCYSTMAEASSSLKLIREAAAACAVQLSQLFPADFGLDAHSESDAAPLANADSDNDQQIVKGPKQQRQRGEVGDAVPIAESWLDVLENGNLSFHAIIIAYLEQDEKLRLQECCTKLNASLQRPAAWKDLNLMYAIYKQGDNNTISTRAGREQLALNRAVIAQPKYSSVYCAYAMDAVLGSQAPASWGKKKKKNGGLVGKHLVQEIMQALPNVQSLSLHGAYLLGKGRTPVLAESLIRHSLSNLRYLACTATITLLRPVLTYCQQLVSLYLTCSQGPQVRHTPSLI
jgi:hypothetical protein